MIHVINAESSVILPGPLGQKNVNKVENGGNSIKYDGSDVARVGVGKWAPTPGGTSAVRSPRAWGQM
jgi:hypothetical protein